MIDQESIMRLTFRRCVAIFAMASTLFSVGQSEPKNCADLFGEARVSAQMSVTTALFKAPNAGISPQVELKLLYDSATQADFKSADYIYRSVTAIMAAIDAKTTHSGDYDYAFALVDRLGKSVENHAALLPILERILQSIEGLQSSPGQVLGKVWVEFLGRFCASRAFNSDVPRILTTALRNAQGEQKLSGIDRLFADSFRYLKDESLRKCITDYILLALNTKNARGRVYLLGASNPDAEEMKHIPIALGPDEVLLELRQRTRSLEFREWQEVGWVRDSKSIQIFRETFFTVATQTDAIHFEVDLLLSDPQALAKAFAEINAVGEQEILRVIELRFRQKKSSAFEAGQVSITDLELYWIVHQPNLVAKTVFYRKGQPLSAAESGEFVRRLVAQSQVW